MTGPAADAAARRGNANAPTIADARRALAAQFRARNIETPELDARVLTGYALGFDHAALASAGRRVLSAEETDALAAVAQRRLAHEPVARILGSKEFWSLQLRIDAATLVPRPETETVVEAALDAVDARGPRSRPRRIADLGTGSGALLLALLTECENAFGVGSDVDPAALRVARNNAQRLGLKRAAFVACDMAAALSGPFDIIVSNPPYIASGDIDALAPEVRDFEPRLALDGGTDGLNFYRAIAAVAPPRLAPGGTLVVELGSGLAQSVGALITAAGLVVSSVRPDLMGVPRALVAMKGHDN